MLAAALHSRTLTPLLCPHTVSALSLLRQRLDNCLHHLVVAVELLLLLQDVLIHLCLELHFVVLVVEHGIAHVDAESPNHIEYRNHLPNHAR